MNRRPTIQDVADQAGVSIATVSRVLNDRADVSVETRERVREVARSVGYTADPAARGLVTQRTQLVAVVVGDNAGHRDLSLLFFGKVMAAVSRRLAVAGYDSAEDGTDGSHSLDEGALHGLFDPEPLDVAAGR